MDNFDFTKIDNYITDFKNEGFIMILKSYIKVMIDFKKYFLNKIKVNRLFLFNKGLNGLSLIFRMIFYYTHNLEFSVENLNNYYFYFIEFITQIKFEKNKEFQLNSIDAFMFILKKSLFNIEKSNNSKREKSNEINNYFTFLDYYIFIINRIFTIFYIINLNNDSKSNTNINFKNNEENVFENEFEDKYEDKYENEYENEENEFDNISQKEKFTNITELESYEINKIISFLSNISNKYNIETIKNLNSIENIENVFYLCLLNNIIKEYHIENIEKSIFENEYITIDVYLQILISLEKNKNRKFKNFDYKKFNCQNKDKLHKYIETFFFL